MRGDKYEKKSTSESLGKTVFTSMIIGGFICFVGMFFPLQQASNEAKDLLAHYLPWCLAYGIPCLGVATYGLCGITMMNSHPFFLKSAGIAGVIAGSLIMISAIPLAIAFRAWEFMISLLVIGACIVAMGALEISALKHKE